MIKKSLIFFFLCISVFTFAKEWNLALSFNDIIITPETNENFVQGNGFHLFIKKSSDIQSVMILNAYPNNSFFTSEILRATEYNPINGNEKRNYKGKKVNFSLLKTSFSLIASKTEKHEILGDCFHIYIPQKVIYGYENSKPVEFKRSDFQNLILRTFNKIGCDYSGIYEDYLFAENTKAKEAFSKLAVAGHGKLIKIQNSAELPYQLEKKISNLNTEESLDLVFIIDATDSMKDDFFELRNNWLPIFMEQIKTFKNIRLGLLFYKDYGDDFKTKGYPVKFFDFTTSASSFSKNLNKISFKGGGDIPEAVHEALYFAINNYSWNIDAKKEIILIGDAEPHDVDDKHNIPFSTISDLISEKDIYMDCFWITDTLRKVESHEKVETTKNITSSDGK